MADALILIDIAANEAVGLHQKMRNQDGGNNYSRLKRIFADYPELQTEIEKDRYEKVN